MLSQPSYTSNHELDAPARTVFRTHVHARDVLSRLESFSRRTNTKAHALVKHLNRAVEVTISLLPRLKLFSRPNITQLAQLSHLTRR